MPMGQRPAIFVAKVDEILVGGAAHRKILRCAAPPTLIFVIICYKYYGALPHRHQVREN